MQLANIPTLVPLPFANSGTKNAIPTASQIGITPGAASLTDGFPPLTFTPLAAGGIPPSGADFNGILNLLSANIQWQNAGGQYVYNSAFSTAIGGYPTGAVLLSSDGSTEWISTADNNTTDPDSSIAANWGKLASYGWATVSGLTNANVILTGAQYGKRYIFASGTLTGNVQLIFPTTEQEWVVVNNTTGAFTLTCKTSAGTGVAIPQGQSLILYGDGTNINSLGVLTQAAADARYAAILNVKFKSTAYTVAASDNNSLIVATAAAATQTLPALSTLTSGVSYVFRFLAEAINVPVTPNSADTLTVNGLTGLTTFPMNPGGELIVCGVGGTAGAWICKYIPAAEVFVNNSATDIVLHVGEKCRYAPSAVANLPLNIACNTLQRYRFEITSTSAGQAVAVQLQVNNTTYASAYSYTYTWVKSDATFAGVWASSTAALTFSTTMLNTMDCNAIVSTDTAGKRCTATMGQSDGTTGYAGTIFSGSSDTTTVWTSLGTIANCPAGNVFVERIA